MYLQTLPWTYLCRHKTKNLYIFLFISWIKVESFFFYIWGALKKAILTRASSSLGWKAQGLSSETVQGTSLAFQSVDNVHCSNCLSLGVLAVCNCITDYVLQEDLEDSTGLFVDQTADTFDSTPSGKTTNSWLCDTLDVIT